MVYCKYCAKDVHSVSSDGILICCGFCKKVLQSDSFTREPAVVKNVVGQLIPLLGELEPGLKPPAFQHAERKKMEKAAAKEHANESNFVFTHCRNREKKLNKSFKNKSSIPKVRGNEKPQSKEAASIGVRESAADDISDVEYHRMDGVSDKALDESESLSDIDDVEIKGYLHNDMEKHYKKIIWERMNREYLQEQAVKEAAAAAAKAAFEANFHGCPEELKAAQEFAASTAAAAAKSKKEKRQKRVAEAKKSGPAQTAAKATREMQTKKRSSSKINYAALDNLYKETEDQENPKKARTESPLNDEDSMNHVSGKGANPEDMYGNEDDEGLVDEYEDDGYTGGEYGNDYFDENAADGYDYDVDNDGCY